MNLTRCSLQNIFEKGFKIKQNLVAFYTIQPATEHMPPLDGAFDHTPTTH